MMEARKFKPSNIIVHLLLIILVLINLFPLYWMVSFSLKSNDEILGYSYKNEAGERIVVPPNHVGLPETMSAFRKPISGATTPRR